MKIMTLLDLIFHVTYCRTMLATDYPHSAQVDMEITNTILAISKNFISAKVMSYYVGKTLRFV